jgi:Uma2 family endonuclease
MTALATAPRPAPRTSSAIQGPRPLQWTVRQYHDLFEHGFFHDQHVFLIDGVVYEEPQMNPAHATSISKGAKTLESAFQSGFYVRVQMPLVLGLMTDPQPDLAVVAGTYQDYASRHPTTAALVLEISYTSLVFDQINKASLYAAAGIADYWIVDLNNRRLEVRRRPIPDAAQPHGFAYADLTTLLPGDSVSPLAAPQVSIRVVDLLP